MADVLARSPLFAFLVLVPTLYQRHASIWRGGGVGENTRVREAWHDVLVLLNVAGTFGSGGRTHRYREA